MKSKVVSSIVLGGCVVAGTGVANKPNDGGGSYSSSNASVTITQNYQINGIPFDSTFMKKSVSSLSYLPSLVMHNKKKVAGYGLLGTWAMMVSYLRYVEWKMTSDALWSRWKLNYSLLDLSTMQENQLEQLLMLDMYQRYSVSQQAFDKSTLFKCFFADVEREEHMLKRYLRLSRICNSTKLTARLCATSLEKHAQAKDQHDRLVFLKVKMWNWIAQKTVE